MAGFSERITLIVDVVTGQAKTGLSQVKSELAQTEGAFNKMKVGAKGAFSTLGVMGPQAAVAAGAALVAFGAKSVNAFQKTALAADKFADSTGMAVEDASRWIAVADDVGVSADTIQGAFIKMQRQIATNRQAFGDLVATAKDGSVDLSQTFLNVITHLQGIQDPIERANQSAKLFGRGFQEVSQLITTDADAIKQALGEVSDAQIISPEEVEKARQYQAAMDKLNDAVRDLTINVGGPLADSLAVAAGALGTVGDALNKLNIATPVFAGALGNLKTIWDGVFGNQVKGVAADLGTIAAGMQQINGQLQAGQVDAGGWGASFSNAAANAEAGINDVSGAYAFLQGQLSNEAALLSLEDQFAQVEDAAIRAFTSAANGEANAAGEARRHASEVNQLKQRVLLYGQEILKLPPQKVSNIMALIDQGKLAEARRALNDVAHPRLSPIAAQVLGISAANAALDSITRTRNANVNVNIIQRGGAGYGGLTGTRASGGMIFPGGFYTMNENGQEAIVQDASGRGRVIPAGTTAKMLGGSGGVTIHVHVAGSVVTERQLIDAVHQGLVAKKRRSGDLGLAS